MQELVQRVMEGYQKYAAEKGYTDPDKFGEYLAVYLQTEEAKEIMNAWQQEIFGDTVINITSDQLKKCIDFVIICHRMDDHISRDQKQQRAIR